MSTTQIPRDVLEAPFPAELIKSRPGAFGNNLSYLEGHTIIARLNEAFDGGWSFEIVEHEILQDEVLVLVKLRAEGFGIAKMAFGSSRITRDKNGNATAIGDDLKAAGTDGLKKAATLLGVGLQLYGQSGSTLNDDGPFTEQPQIPTPVSRYGNNPPSRQVIQFKQPKAPTEDPNAGNNGNGSGGSANGNADTGMGRITSKQLAAIFAIARDRQMSNQDVRELCKSTFNRVLDYLSKSEASAMIEHLLAQ